MRDAIRRRLSGDDRGAAMVLVLGVMMVFAIVSVTLVGTTVFATSRASETRAGVQTQNAVEQAIDLALAQLNTTATRGQEGTFPCAINSSFTTPSGTVDVAISIEYEVGATYVCPAASGVALTGARFTARAHTDLMTGEGLQEVDRVMRQEFDLAPMGPGAPVFGYGVFSNADIDTTNTFKVVDGGLHTNGNFKCTTQAQINGLVSAVGNANFTNSCRMEGLWVGGTVTCTSQSFIDGDVRASGTGGSSFTNNCTVTGDAILGGSVTGSGWSPLAGQTKNVYGDLISATGNISLQATARIGGNAQAKGTITLNNGTPITSTHINGSVTQNSPSGVPAPPPVQSMPAIYYSDIVRPGDPAPLLFKKWLQDEAIANNAATWTDPRKGVACTAVGANWSMNGVLRSPVTPTVVDARACSTATFQDITVYLRNDLTILVNSFDATNGVTIVGQKPGSNAKLRIISVLPDGASTCSPATGGTISFQGGGTDFLNSVDTFLYTNKKVSLVNTVGMNGSVYACETNFANSTTINYADMTPPGMEDPGGTLYEFLPTVRYDLDADA